MQSLEKNWLEILEPYRVAAGPALALFEELSRTYCGLGRYYHTLPHIRHVLQVVDSLGHKIENGTAVRLAAWYHDIIYDSTAKDNEEKSAELAGQRLKEIRLPAEIIAETTRLILLTRQHTTPDNDANGRVLLDADLAILGASREQYQAYARAIRQEYAWVEDEAYRQGRKKVLESFLTRPRLYCTSELFEALEGPARRNIAAEIATLSF
jgi:predicted metal-dependent HD superfamily phosphohydrolase